VGRLFRVCGLGGVPSLAGINSSDPTTLRLRTGLSCSAASRLGMIRFSGFDAIPYLHFYFISISIWLHPLSPSLFEPSPISIMFDSIPYPHPYFGKGLFSVLG
jgi:hypothetical protein